MRTRIQRWGNSLALRIPRPFAVEANLGQDSPVDVTLVDGRLVITPIVEPHDALAALLDGITDENRHQELQTGSPAGEEVW